MLVNAKSTLIIDSTRGFHKITWNLLTLNSKELSNSITISAVSCDKIFPKPMYSLLSGDF